MNNTAMAIGLTAVVAYLLGSINCSIIISRYILKTDVRKLGSGNAGTTNMIRNFGVWPAVCTFVGDFLKGFAAVMLGRLFFNLFDVAGYGAFLGAYCVILGHVFPIFFGFKGGKGIAAALGVLVAIHPLVFLIIGVIFIPIVPITGYVSLASVSGAAAFPVVLYLFRRAQGQVDPIEILLAAVLAAIVIYLHRANIGRLLKGTENKLTRKKPAPSGEGEDKS